LGSRSVDRLPLLGAGIEWVPPSSASEQHQLAYPNLLRRIDRFDREISSAARNIE
jgi:hypothetical protein